MSKRARNMAEIKNVAVIGAGTMGHALAQVFASHGCTVGLTDNRKDELPVALGLIRANLETMAEAGRMPAEEIGPTLARIRPSARIEEAAGSADLAIEAVVEDRAVKQAVFAALDRHCPPHAILASNTSYLNIFDFVRTGRPDRVAITHWFTPPHIIPLVEIVCGPQTSPETAATLERLLAAMGKKPIVIRRFLPGFIANRLQSALTQEALFLLDNGYATAEEIDAAARSSFALRTPFLGLVKRFDYAGLDLTQKILRNRQYAPSQPIDRSAAVDRLIESGNLGVKTGRGFYDYGGRSPQDLARERDRKLLRLLKLLEELEES
jgi:3-hydroxybutyryl-CoA dehydrogenase